MSETLCPRCNDQLTSFLPSVTAGNNCGECSRYRHSLNEPAFLYLISHKELKKHKIGIGMSGVRRSRLEELISAGYKVHGIWHAADKKKTYNWEQRVFKEIAAKVKPLNSDEPDPMGNWVRNWSEGIHAEAITLLALEKLINRIVKN